MEEFINPETGESTEMSMEEILELLRQGNGSLQQQVHHADGSVTSSMIYGNDIGDGIDRSVNIFGTSNDIMLPAFARARLIKKADENEENIFCMDDSDINYEVTVDDTTIPLMHVITCTKDSIKIARYLRDERKSIGEPMGESELKFVNGKATASMEQVENDNLIPFIFGVRAIRDILRERGILQELQQLENKGSGVIITASEDDIEARIVRGYARPDLPCMMFGGLFAQSLDDAVMMRPYMDELLSAAMYENASLEEKIKAAEDGNTCLMDELALYYLNECDEPDGEQAFYWFKKLAAAGVTTGMFNAGLHYAKGFGVERSFKDALYWMEKAAEAGDTDAPAMIAELKKALNAEKKAADGDAQAQADLAGVYMVLGKTLDQADSAEDYALSLEYAQKAAAQNNGDGIWTLALAYEHGRGVENNLDKAIELYRKGAELGHARSQHSYGCKILNGDCDGMDDTDVFRLFEAAALQGYNLAEQGLSKLYETGRGTELDLDKAIEWGEKAAESGDANIQYEVAKLYTYNDDEGNMIDMERARYWYSQAAEKGHEMAASILNFAPMWGETPDFEGDDDEDIDDYDFWGNGDEAKENTVPPEELQAMSRKLAEIIFSNDDGTVKTLILNTDKNCLEHIENTPISIEALNENRHLLFSLDAVDPELSPDCFMIVESATEPNMFGPTTNKYTIHLSYKTAINDLDGYKARPFEIADRLCNIFDTAEFPDDMRKPYYCVSSTMMISDEYSTTSIVFSDSEIYASSQVNDTFKDYDKSNGAIIEAFMKNDKFKELMEITGKSAEEAYGDGHFTLIDSFNEDDDTHKIKLMLTWNYSLQTTLTVCPLVRDKKLLKPVISEIKKSLKGLKLPTGNAISYSSNFSQEELCLNDNLTAALLIFT